MASWRILSHTVDIFEPWWPLGFHLEDYVLSWSCWALGGWQFILEFDFDLMEKAIQRFGGEKLMVGRALDSAKKPHRDFERLSGMPVAGLASSAGKGNAIKGHEDLVDWQSRVDFDVYASGAVLPHGAARMWSAGLSCFQIGRAHV